MKRLEVVGGLVAVTCFVGAVYCSYLRGEACWHPRSYDAAAGRTHPIRCKAAGRSFGTPQEAWWMNVGTWLFWLGAGGGAYVFTWHERQPPPKR